MRVGSVGHADTLLGREFAGYELSEHIADGGMSRVYRARRADGQFDREVAVKISVASLLDERLRERFLQEQQILAGLNHPCIAQLYDAGISVEGWPFIVMELVDGTPIDRFCADVDIDRKVDLLIRVCDALTFAHARLVVHRDIKPGNVLVTRDGEPKLLDFGIAKLLSANASATQVPSLTPRYASPEQLLGQPASVASDVYQVGLLLAEVLHRELVEPPGSLAVAVRRATAGAPTVVNREIGKRLPRELVNIVEKCISPDPVDRYAEVSDVREDFVLYLRGFPVSASGYGRVYRARKFVARNRLALVSATLAATAFVASGVWYLAEVNAARDRAELEAATSSQVTEFLVGLFRSSAPSQRRGEDLTAGQLLERGLERINELDGSPLVHAQLQSALGSVYLDLGDLQTARNLTEHALAVQRRELGEMHPSALATLKNLAAVALLEGALDEAQRLYEEALELHAHSLGDLHEETLDARRGLGSVFRDRGEFAKSADIQEEVVEGYRALGQYESSNGINAITGLAVSTIQAGDPQAAIPYFEEALRLSREVLGPNHPRTISAINNMAVTYQEIGRPAQAVPYSLEAYRSANKVYGNEHHLTIRTAANHSNALREAGQVNEARPFAEQAYEKAIANLPTNHGATDFAITEMGQIELASGNFARAEALFAELLEIEREHLGEAHMYTIGTQLKLASAMAAQDRVNEAAALVEEAVALMHETQGPEHPETLMAEKQLARLRMQQGEIAEARELVQRVLPGLIEHFGEEARQVRETRDLLNDLRSRTDI